MKFWNRVRQYPNLGLVILAYVAFISLGLPDGLLGVAWPTMRADFSVPLDAVGVLLVASVLGYSTSSFLSGALIARFGVGRVLAYSCALTGASLLGYTLVPEWWMMVLLVVPAGLGAGAIDAGLNTYAAAHFSEGVMQWLHASWGVGVTIGPIIMTLALTNFNWWGAGYRVVALAQLLLAAGFFLTVSMWSRNGRSSGETRRLTDYKTPYSESLRQPRAWLSVALFVLYVGVEASLGIWTYTLLIGSRGIDPAAAGFWAGSYWATFTIGRVAAGLLTKRVSVDSMVIGGLGFALLGMLLLIWNPLPAANLLAVAIIGFSLAPVFPAMMSGTSRRVGDHLAANTIGMQMAATGVGTALIPGMLGVLARRVSLEAIPWGQLAVLGGLLLLYLLAVRSSPVTK